ncbi:MAG TPA: TIGR04282 family arsenosugar biosynthesis glycosyltransferase [Thermodesulfovibrionales bacterium]|nr:TIGR04282 family arsenosugar biosynthesis glycosyltransferase [Thermodesulfovibrionales bacterium]
MSCRSSLLLFVRSPKMGRVKSRLAAVLGAETTLALYRNFVFDIICTLERRSDPLLIFFDPPDAEGEIRNWLGKGHAYFPQSGNDLGERMENAFVRSFAEGIEKAVLIGSDIPDLTDHVISEAFASLETRGAVIGPAVDGGYYLIGFRRERFLPEIFRGIQWSTGSVFADTMKAFERFGCGAHVLPEWRDVDTPEDLADLFLRNRDTQFRKSKTMSLIDTIRNSVSL